MAKKDNRKFKYGYFQFILLLLALGLILFFLSNPHSVSKTDFNNTYSPKSTYSDLTSFSEQYEFVKQNIDNLPDKALNMKNWEQINDSQSDLIISERNTAENYFSLYNQGKDIEDFQRALFHIQLSYAYTKTLPTLNCANKVEDTSKKYNPWLFYYLSYSDKEKVSEILFTKKRINNFLDLTERYSDDFNITLRKTKDSLNIEESLDLSKLKCEDFEKYLQGDYQRQKNWLVFKFIALIITLIFGIFLNSSVNRWVNRKNKKIFPIWVKEIFHPKEIKIKTIESILKTNTILTVFVTVALGLINLNELVLKMFAIYAFADIIILLASIVIGIASLNNSSEESKKWCYSLYVWGIIGFIGVIVFFVVVLALTGFGKMIKQSLQTFLNNQTISS